MILVKFRYYLEKWRKVQNIIKLIVFKNMRSKSLEINKRPESSVF